MARASPSLSSLPGTSEDERDGFHHFRICTAAQSKDYFAEADSFWAGDVLRASHNVSAVRHAATSLGTMHKKFLAGKGKQAHSRKTGRSLLTLTVHLIKRRLLL